MVCNDCILFLYEGKLLGARWEDCGKKSPQMTEKDARMSRVLDIRSYFSPGAKSKLSSSSDEKSKGLKTNKKDEPTKKQKKKRKKRTFDSDSEEEPLPKKLRKGNGSKKTIIEESDDDDLVITKEEKGKPAVKENSKKVKGAVDKKTKEQPKQSLKPTTAIDFFGSTPVKQTGKVSTLAITKAPKDDAKAKKKKDEKSDSKSRGPKKDKQDRKDKTVEIDIIANDDDWVGIIDDDEDFEKSIQELDSSPSEGISKGNSKSTPKKGKLVFKDESPLPPKKRAAEESVQSVTQGNSSLGKKKKSSTVAETVSSEKEKISKKENKDVNNENKDRKEEESKSETGAAGTSSIEKKKSYFAYKAREGPRNLGSKEIPQGADNCLEGLSFVITGVLESIEREQAVDLVKRYGGKVVSAVSKRTSYLIVGRDPGESKLQKASNFGIKQLDEEGFFTLIRELPGKVSKYEEQSVKEKKKESHHDTTEVLTSKYFKGDEKPEDTSGPRAEMQRSKVCESGNLEPQSQSSQLEKSDQEERDSQKSLTGLSNPPRKEVGSSQPSQEKAAEVLLWVDKYKPTAMKNIVGQHGEKSNARKLLKWLINWDDNNSGGGKPKGKGGFFAAKEDGSIFKCALLSGPPGVGKTTTATLVCKEAGYSFMELNASDTRSKNTLKQYISEVLSNNTVDNILSGKKETSTGHHALIMDEVDGMAGNEDRGGVQELIGLIKGTKIPIICMCNDRNHPKIRSLANYCFDLRFHKPKVDSIKGFAMSVAFKEGLKLPAPVMDQIIVGANQDIRQVLHNLQMWSSTKKSLTYDEAKEEASKSKKNIKIGPFDIVQKLFSASESENMSIDDKLGLFFNDYSFVPLFVQENYLLANPMRARGNERKTLEQLSSAADAIADSNRVEKLIRESQAWSLLPLQGFYSCVAAPDVMRGGLTQRINFPQWLGKNSSQGKHDRILQELKMHMRLSCLAGKSDLNMDYAWLMRKKLVSPLVDPGDDVSSSARRVIDLMNSYNLTREDWESFIEIGKWDTQQDITASIPSKVKAAFTRAYNKEVHLTPYATGTIAKKKRVATVSDEFGADDTVPSDEEDDEDDTDITKDSMIKISKKKGGEASQGQAGKGKGRSAPKNSGKGGGRTKSKV